MQNTFFVVGQTAAGKTAAAVALAERWNGEIVSADAFQVYAGLDLLTAKPAAEELARAPHHLIRSVPLTASYNVARFREEALRCIAEIHLRGRWAIVAGGSGLYIKALTHGLSPLPSADPALRAELDTLDAAELLARLRTLDPAAASTIDALNKRRLVRALEVCLATGKPVSNQRGEWARSEPQHARGVFLFRDRGELHERISARVESMFSAGVLDEVRALGENKLATSAERIIGLADIRLHLAGKLDLATCKDRIKAATRQYAKRQMTWFKREQVFEPVNLSLAEGHARMASLADRRDCSNGA
jgi:tRNA dimethylallyltransferase